MMKVLIPALYNASPHFDTELEIIENHLEGGDDVYYVKCCGEIKTGFLHTLHPGDDCALCQKRFDKGVSLLRAKVHILKYPQDESMFLQEKIVVSDVDAMKAIHIAGINHGMGVASTIISELEDECFDTEIYADKIQQNFETSYFMYNAFSKLLHEVCPDVVYLFNGRFSFAAPIIAACQTFGVTFFTHERAGVNERYTVTKNALPHAIGPITETCEALYVQYPANIARQIAHENFAGRRQGNPDIAIPFIKEQSAGRLPEAFDKDQKNIVVFNSSVFEFAALPGFGSISGFYASEGQALRAIAESLKDDSNIHLYCRLHPNLAGRSSKQLQDIYAACEGLSNLTVIPPESSVDSYTLMDKANIVMVFHSTMGAEALYWGKPVIVLGQASYMYLNGFYRPSSHEEVLQLLRSDNLPVNDEGAIKYGLFFQKSGLEYKWYKPTVSSRGKFKGIDLMESVSLTAAEKFYVKFQRFCLFAKKSINVAVSLLGVRGAAAAREALVTVSKKLGVRLGARQKTI